MANDDELQQLTADKPDPEDNRDEEAGSSVGSQKRFTNMSPIVTTSYVCSFALLILIFYKVLSGPLSLFSLHPICTVTGWVLLATSAIHTISPGDALTEWIPVKNASTRHWILQGMGLIFTTVGFVAIYINKYLNNKNHFTSYHGLFGLITVILAAASSSGGITALYGMKLKHLLAPIYLKLIHSAAGIFTYGFAMVTIILGYSSSWLSTNPIIQTLSITLVIVLSAMTLLRPTIKLYVRVRERLSYLQSAN